MVTASNTGSAGLGAVTPTREEFRELAADHRVIPVVRRMLADHAAQAGVGDPEAFAYQMQILMMGAMLSALRGDLEAAKRAREIAAAWLSSDPAVRSRRS